MSVFNIVDEELGTSRKKSVMTLDCLTESMSLREIVRARIYQEVAEYNHSLREGTLPEIATMLIQPTLAESMLNKPKDKARKRKMVNWEEQFQVACDSFEQNGFFVLVGDHQAESLDDEFITKVDTDVTFVKLVMLAGG